jgi:hypothetical protein
MKKLIVTISFLGFAAMLNAQKVVCDPSKEKNYKCLTKQNEKGGYGAVITKEGAVTLAQGRGRYESKRRDEERKM